MQPETPQINPYGAPQAPVGDYVTGDHAVLERARSVPADHAGGVDFRSGDTENECWRRAAPVLSTDGGTYFRSLLDAWLVTAYAHRPPPVADLVDLCDRWPAHFRGETFARGTPQ